MSIPILDPLKPDVELQLPPRSKALRKGVPDPPPPPTPPVPVIPPLRLFEVQYVVPGTTSPIYAQVVAHIAQLSEKVVAFYEFELRGADVLTLLRFAASQWVSVKDLGLPPASASIQ